MAQAYREVKVITGNFARVNIFPVRTYQIGRKAKNKPTAAAQDRLNREMRRRKLSDLINLNFTKKDIQLKKVIDLMYEKAVVTKVAPKEEE